MKTTNIELVKASAKYAQNIRKVSDILIDAIESEINYYDVADAIKKLNSYTTEFLILISDIILGINNDE